MKNPKANNLQLVLARYLVPVVFCTVALNQIFHAHFGLLTPWKGGGFGMFSTTDRPTSRLVFIQLETDKQTYMVHCPKELAEECLAALSYPSEMRVGDFASQLCQFSWMDYGVVSAKPERSLVRSERDAPSDTIASDQLPIFDSSGRMFTSRNFVGIDSPRFDHLPDGTPLAVRAISVEVWRVGHSPCQVTLRKLISLGVQKDE